LDISLHLVPGISPIRSVRGVYISIAHGRFLSLTSDINETLLLCDLIRH